MITQSIQRLEYLCNTIPELLHAIDDTSFSAKPLPHKWSSKEIIGHLIDSATNNHHRLVRGQFENIPSISYNQDKWNEFNYYQQFDKTQIINFWAAYNRQLLGLMKHMPTDKLKNEINTGGESNITIEFLINDYVVHLEHHLKQVVVY